MDGFTASGLARLDRVMAGHVESGSVAGLVSAVSRRGGEAHVGWAGTAEERGAGAAVGRETIFRLSSD